MSIEGYYRVVITPKPFEVLVASESSNETAGFVKAHLKAIETKSVAELLENADYKSEWEF